MTDKNKILQKIKKCMALSASSNPHEAAAAMRQAQKLMAKFGISDDEVRLADVAEAHCTTCMRSATGWMAFLANTVAKAYRCEVWFTNAYAWETVHAVFCGVQPAQELAVYSFTVLRRLLSAQRSTYYKKTRGKRSNRIARADSYALGWITRVRIEVDRFAGAIPNVVIEHTSSVGLVGNAVATRSLDERAVRQGWLDARDVRLQHGVAGAEQARIG